MRNGVKVWFRKISILGTIFFLVSKLSIFLISRTIFYKTCFRLSKAIGYYCQCVVAMHFKIIPHHCNIEVYLSMKSRMFTYKFVQTLWCKLRSVQDYCNFFFIFYHEILRMEYGTFHTKMFLRCCFLPL